MLIYLYSIFKQVADHLEFSRPYAEMLLVGTNVDWKENDYYLLDVVV